MVVFEEEAEVKGSKRYGTNLEELMAQASEQIFVQAKAVAVCHQYACKYSNRGEKDGVKSCIT